MSVLLSEPVTHLQPTLLGTLFLLVLLCLVELEALLYLGGV